METLYCCVRSKTLQCYSLSNIYHSQSHKRLTHRVLRIQVLNAYDENVLGLYYDLQLTGIIWKVISIFLTPTDTFTASIFQSQVYFRAGVLNLGSMYPKGVHLPIWRGTFTYMKGYIYLYEGVHLPIWRGIFKNSNRRENNNLYITFFQIFISEYYFQKSFYAYC